MSLMSYILSAIFIFTMIIVLCIPIIGYNEECMIGLICGFIIGLAICHIDKLLCTSEMYIELKCNSMHCINTVRITKQYYNYIKNNNEINKHIRCSYHKNEVHPCDDILIIYC
jgi:hypothetical protein